MPLTVTPNPSGGYVTVDVSGLTGTITVNRQTPGGPSIPVRNMDPVGVGVTSVNDRECPFNTPVVYTASYGTSSTATASATLTATQARLEHPGFSALGVWCRVVDDTPPEWESPSVVHAIIGRTEPVVTAQTMRARSGVLRLAVDGTGGLNQLLGLWQSGLPVLLRVPNPSLLRDGWLAAARVTDAHTRATSTERMIDVEYQVAARPVGNATDSPAYTWQAAVSGLPSWSSAKATYTTWTLLVAGPQS